MIESTRAEKQPAESEARLRAIVDTVVEGIITIDEHGIVQSMNRAAELMFGYEAEEVIGNNVSMLMPSPHREAHDRHIARYLSTGEAKIIGIGREVEGQRKDGARFPMGLAVGEFKEGKRCFFTGVVRDITEQKRLQQQEARFDRILDRSLNEIYTFDAETLHFIRVNQGAQDNLGYTMEELCALTPLEIKPEYTKETFNALILPLCTGEQDKIEFTTTHRRKNGSLYPVEVHLQLSSFEAKPVFLAIILDITDRRKAEQALREQKERIETTLQSIGDAVITTSANGAIDYLNPVAEALTGWSLDEVQDLPLTTVLKLISEENRERVLNPVVQCLAEEKGSGIGNHMILISRDGQEHAIRNSVAPIRDHRSNILGVVLVLHDVTEARRMAREIKHQASHDALTGLVNRREFEHRLQRVLETTQADSGEHALCYLDLDQFKVINDSCGHVAGDELLRQLARLFQHNIRKRDTLARLGGDEFGILMEHCALDQANRVAHVLRDTVEKFRFLWDNKRFNIGVSIGVVSINECSGEINSVLRAADTACYAAKDSGRNRIHTYHEEDEELVRRHGEMQWVSRIHRALDEDRFQLMVQPIIPVDPVKNTVYLFELLLRMKDEDGRLVTPGVFLPAAERYNISSKIDRWVVRNALDWLAEHPKHSDHPCLCTVNLSGQSLGDEEFLKFLVDRFSANQVCTNKICFEVTETAAIANLSSATRFMKILKELGCKFALDDFGSGLSSFAYLKNLPVDFLKIDGVFVKDMLNDPIDLALVKCIHEIGRVLGKLTVAEFVENQSTLDKLSEIGIDFAQGYAIGHPQPLDTVFIHSYEVTNFPGLGMEI